MKLTNLSIFLFEKFRIKKKIYSVLKHTALYYIYTRFKYTTKLRKIEKEYLHEPRFLSHQWLVKYYNRRKTNQNIYTNKIRTNVD